MTFHQIAHTPSVLFPFWLALKVSPFVISPPPFIRAPVADPFVLIGTLSVLCDGSECTGRSTSCQRNQTDSYVKSNMLLLFRRCQCSIGMDSMLLTTPGMDMCLFMHTDNFPQGWVSKYIWVSGGPWLKVIITIIICVKSWIIKSCFFILLYWNISALFKWFLNYWHEVQQFSDT